MKGNWREWQRRMAAEHNEGLDARLMLRVLWWLHGRRYPYL